jgi:hypothetical protein
MKFPVCVVSFAIALMFCVLSITPGTADTDMLDPWMVSASHATRSASRVTQSMFLAKSVTVVGAADDDGAYVLI